VRLGPAWVRDWGWKTREKKNNTARNNSLSLSKKTKKERKNVERNKKEGKHLSIIEIFKIFRSQELQ